MQEESFPSEIDFLKNKKDSIPNLVNQLDLFLDDRGIIRSKGRVSKGLHSDFNVINPILLGKNHHLTSLIIRDAHFGIQHLGRHFILEHMKSSGFWIPKARLVIKKVLKSCTVCKQNSNNDFSFKIPDFNIPRKPPEQAAFNCSQLIRDKFNDS
jgi:hypothetical protein